jgi:peptide/nickel transport system substrate-binding protein
VQDASDGAPLRLRIAVPDGPGYRIVFAHIRRDWRMIGVEAVRVPAGAPAELRLVDMVAPAELGSWYLRPFICGQSPVCDEVASQALEGARAAATPAERQALLAQADVELTNVAAFIPLGSPMRWSLRSNRLTAFRINPFARHSLTELVPRRD